MICWLSLISGVHLVNMSQSEYILLSYDPWNKATIVPSPDARNMREGFLLFLSWRSESLWKSFLCFSWWPTITDMGLKSSLTFFPSLISNVVQSRYAVVWNARFHHQNHLDFVKHLLNCLKRFTLIVNGWLFNIIWQSLSA